MINLARMLLIKKLTDSDLLERLMGRMADELNVVLDNEETLDAFAEAADDAITEAVAALSAAMKDAAP